MPVNSCHRDFTDASDRWQTIRDCIAGSDAIKAAGTRYLPALGSHEGVKGAYQNYKFRALWVNATNRTHDALLGFLFRKEPQITLGPKGSTTTLISEEEQANIDLGGNSILDYARLVGDDVASIGRAGTLIDMTTDEGKPRPRFSFYAAERIINWRAQVFGGKTLLTLLVLEEIVETAGGDEFDRPEEMQYRVLRLTDAGVHVEIHKGVTEQKPITSDGIQTRGGELASSFTVEDLGVMMRRGRPLMEIPFIFHNADHVGPAVGISPLYDLACINLSHYQTSADTENARHTLGSPTPYAFGLTSNGKQVDTDLLYLGGPAWVSDNPDAKAGFIEFTGAGLGELKDALQEKIVTMAAIGARMIEPKSGDAEAFETVALRATSETSALSSIAIHLSRSMTDCLKWYVWWTNADDSYEDVKDVAFEINRDFVAQRLTSQDLSAFGAAYASGVMSFETLFWNMQRADMYPPGRTMEEERAAIDEQMQMPIPGAIGDAFARDAEDKRAKDAADAAADDLEDADDPQPPAAKKTAKKAAGKKPPRE